MLTWTTISVSRVGALDREQLLDVLVLLCALLAGVDLDDAALVATVEELTRPR
jgi:hypothetical protein